MSRSVELHRLINSMTKAEKRHFTMSVARYAKQGSNNLLRLFEAYDSLKNFDETRFLESVKDETFAKHLATVNLQLSNAIVESMHNLHGRHQDLSRVAEYMYAVRYLNERGIRGLARKYLNKAAEIAAARSRQTLMLEVADLRREMIVHYNINSHQDELSGLLQQQRTTLDKVNNEFEYIALHHRVSVLTRRSLDSRDPILQVEVNRILEDPLVASPDRILTVKSRLLYFRILADCSLMLDRLNEAYRYQSEIIKLWEQHSDEVLQNLGQYRGDLINMLNRCFAVEQFEMFEPTLEKVKQLPILSHVDQVKYFSQVLYAEFYYYLQNGDLDKCQAALVEINQGMIKFGAEISVSLQMTMLSNVTVYHFLSGDFVAAEKSLMDLSGMNTGSVRRDIEAFARLLTPVVHYELDKIELLESRHRSAYRYFKGQDEAYEFELIVLKFINKLRGQPEGEESHKTFKQFDVALREVEAGFEGRSPMGLTEIQFWVESNISGKPLREVFLAKVAERQHS